MASYVWPPAQAPAGGVTTLNGLSGALTLVAGAGITITPAGSNITIAATGGGVTSVTASSPLFSSGGTTPNLTIQVATAAQNGYLSATDWNTFNNKQNALTLGNLTDVGTDGITITGGTGAVIGAGTSISQHVSDSTHNGYLSLTDWNTFNSKQAAGNYLTALTGDGTATGPGSAVFTLTTVNANIGSFGSASSVGAFTVNAKGLITAASSVSIQIAESQVTNLVSDLAGKQPVGNYITALTGDVTATGPGSVAATISVGAVTDTKGSLANKPAVTVVATTNQALTGTPTIDGQATTAGTSIVLATAQTTGSENGPWVVQSGAWTRPTWYPSGGTTQAFQFITTLVRLGTTYQGSTWRMTTAGAITIDTTSTTWVITPLANNALTIPVTTTPVNNAASPYTVLNTDQYIMVDSSAGAVSLNLPNPSTKRVFRVVDVGGVAATNNITLVRFAAENIVGLAASKVLQTNYGAWSVLSDGTNWWLI